MRLLAPLAAFALGAGTGAAAVVLHGFGWAVALAWAASLLSAYALPAGLRARIPYALGWMLALALAVWQRPTGGYLMGSEPGGYLVMGLGLVVLSFSIATIPLKRRRRLAGHDQAAGDPDHLAG